MMEIGKDVPGIEAVSCWDFYSQILMQQILMIVNMLIQRHSFNRQQFAELVKETFIYSEKLENV